MAKAEKELSTDTYEDYVNRTGLKKKESREHYDKRNKLRDLFEKARLHRANSCIWREDGNYNKHWDEQEKIALGWGWDQFDENGDFTSNIKSPMTVGRIDAMIHKLMKTNVHWTVLSVEDKDKIIAKVKEQLLDDFFYKGEVEETQEIILRNTCIYGTAWSRLYHLRDEREYTFLKEDINDMTDDEKKLAKEGKKVWGKKQTEVRYNNAVWEPLEIRAVYVDPDARDLHSQYYSAKYWFLKRVLHIDDFKAEFGNDPDAFNVDKVKTVGEYYESYDEDPFYKVCKQPGHADYVVVFEYENELDDNYCVIANDIIIKDHPLPYNHKQLTLHRTVLIPHPHNLYGIGLTDRLRPHQIAEEITLNLIQDYVYRTIDKQFLVDDIAFGDLAQQYLAGGSKFIPMDTQNGRPMSSLVYEMANTPISFDVFKTLEILEKNATLASQVDPSQANLVQKDVTATSIMNMKELSEAFVAYVLKNYGRTLVRVGKQLDALNTQKLTVPEVKRIIGKDGKEKYEEKFRKVRLDGFKIVEDVNDDQESELRMEQIEGSSYFELKPGFLNPHDECDIRLAAESFKIMSKGFEFQKAQELLAQLMPMAVDPNNPMQVANHPNPQVNVIKLLDYASEKLDFPKDILLHTSMNDDYERATAKADINQILNGHNTPGMAGRSPAHIEFENKALNAIDTQIELLQGEIEEIMASQQQAPMLDPMTGQMIQPEFDLPQDKIDEVEFLIKAREKIAKHIMQDSTILTVPQPNEMAAPMQVPGMDANLIPSGDLGGQVPMPQGINPMMTTS